MYREFYGLREYPFNVSPDPRFLHLTSGAYNALACLFYVLSRRRGFVLLTGEVGTGKTTLTNCLLLELRKRQVPAGVLVNPRLDSKEFLEFVLSEFGIPCPGGGKGQMLRQLLRWLQLRERGGGTAVLVVDEAHTLSLDLLEEIRLLTNFETQKGKLLQIVLSGQPELEQTLDLPQMRQVKQRIVLHARLQPLSSEETQGYIRTRLNRARGKDNGIFSPDAISAIHRYSKGIPRLINLICENALIGGFAAQARPVSRELVEQAARDLRLDGMGSAKPSVPQFPAELPAALEKLLSDSRFSTAFLNFLQLIEQRRVT